MSKEEFHVPVLLQESVDGLNVKEDGVYVDLTFGGGGHSREILKRLGEKGRLIAFDQDKDAIKNLPQDNRLIFVGQNFRYVVNYLQLYKVVPVDGILADLGISSHQINEGERGFSTRFDATLDMRMNNAAGMSAADVLNTYEEDALRIVFKKYGELQRARKMAALIVEARKVKPVDTTFQLKEILVGLKGGEHEAKFFAKVFQALRIEVNQEIAVLEQMLTGCEDLIKKDGRLVIIAYHSLEDRPVKNYMKSGNLKGVVEKDFFGNQLKPFEMITRKPIVPTDEEMKRNPRARSAKLRIAKKL